MHTLRIQYRLHKILIQYIVFVGLELSKPSKYNLL